MSSEEKQDNNKQRCAGLSFADNKVFYSSSLALFGLWLVFCWQGLTTAVEIWYGNEIFNHGFFIVPGALYLIYLKRFELLSKHIQTSPLALIVLIPALLLYVIGVAGDIQLFLHAATFTLLPALIWLVIGTAAAKTILFPLVFMLFSIPVGEQLIPYLQEIAADGSVALLRLTGVPLFRSGLYIEIPQGRFLVAEACSGVSFFIASFVIGSLYAYLNLVSVKRRALFVIISLIFPILANIVRVYGIILIAYWTDMEHAAGADHLIYGWFFFAFVILCLLGIGELMRQQPTEQDQPKYTKCEIKENNVTISSLVIILFCVCFIWQKLIATSNPSIFQIPPPILTNYIDNKCQGTLWKPVIKNPDVEEIGFLKSTDCKIKVYTAWFSEHESELVSGLHRSFDPEYYSLNGESQLRFGELTLSIHEVISPIGNKLNIVKWYELNDKCLTNPVKTKLIQLKNSLLGKEKGGRIWIVALEEVNDSQLESIVCVGAS